MLKILAFLTKTEGMRMQDFIDYYENKHVPLICSLAHRLQTQVPCAGRGID
jgi:hypothetical protein